MWSPYVAHAELPFLIHNIQSVSPGLLFRNLQIGLSAFLPLFTSFLPLSLHGNKPHTIEVCLGRDIKPLTVQADLHTN